MENNVEISQIAEINKSMITHALKKQQQYVMYPLFVASSLICCINILKSHVYDPLGGAVELTRAQLIF